jgi:Rad3-related DNA helicase
MASSSRRRGSVSSVVVTSATLDSLASFLSNLPAKENGLVYIRDAPLLGLGSMHPAPPQPGPVKLKIRA